MNKTLGPVAAILQARMASTRFPGKVMKLLGGMPMIGFQIKRLIRSERITKIILATTNDVADDPLAHYVASIGIEVFRGDQNDVLDRYYHAALANPIDVVVRITGDCPLIDPTLVDDVVFDLMSKGVDFSCNNDPPTLPDGLDVEAFTFKALESAWHNATSSFDREHVTPYIKNSGKFSLSKLTYADVDSRDRWTVDEPEDYAVIQAVVNHFGENSFFTWRDVVDLQSLQPSIFEANRDFIRNEGASLSVGQKLWKRAKRIIPGGSMLLSKRAEMFLPEKWPTYFSRAKGCRVWDLEDREYLDMSLMGVGTNILGYGHPEVDAAVSTVIAKGNMSTLNCPEEVFLAEKLIELHPWAQMVRFARTGGEANAIAIRIARAASGKDHIAVCGYHGWHDWYLAANLGNGNEGNLAQHLLPGLSPIGVPACLKNLTHTFNYNDFTALENLINQHKVGVVIMEVMRNMPPQEGFLEKVRKITSDNGIVLVFDECTSGFRETFGGLHKKYGVNPDLAMFGKALGNGYSINAIIGRRDVMEHAQDSFISSTFWTERIGPTAALATLKAMEEIKSWELITAIGGKVILLWRDLANKYGIDLIIQGLPSLASFTIPGSNAMIYKTLITQELLKHDILASNSVYACIAHDREVLECYAKHLDSVFSLIAECENGRECKTLLAGPVCQSGFTRLN